jgi:phosphatidylserine/phosphatidylglycerophosphate/cardiolipin synthase-like enzyme
MGRPRRVFVSVFIVCGLSVAGAQNSGTRVQITTAFGPDPALPDNTPIAQQWTANISAAQHSLRLTFYNFTLNAVRDAIIAAKAANPSLDVRGVLDKSQITSANVRALACEAGAQFKYWDPASTSDLVHHKFMIIDGDDANPAVVTGSANFTVAGVRFSHENQAAFTYIDGDRSFFDAYVSQFEAMWSDTFTFPPGSSFKDYVPSPPC